METTQTLRIATRQAVIEEVQEAAKLMHKRNYHKLHIWRDGTTTWDQDINKSSDIIDRRAAGFAAVPSVACVGTGGYVCNCDHCSDESYASQEDAIQDAVADSDLGDLEEAMLVEFDRIPPGYFDDEEAA